MAKFIFITIAATVVANAQDWQWDRSNTLLNPSRINIVGVSSPFLYDIDSDNDLDLIVGQGDGTIMLYYNDGFPDVVAWRADSSYFSTLHFDYVVVPTLGDIDGDDSLELVVSFKDLDYPIDSLRAFRNRGTPATPDWQELPGYFDSQVAMPICDQKFNDWDGDGDCDLIARDDAQNRFVFYRNTGTSGNPYWAFDSTMTLAIDPQAPPGDYNGLEVADFNNDGAYDLAISLMIYDALIYFTEIHINRGSNETPVFDIYRDFELDLTAGSANTLSSGDLDNDGDLDLICGGSYGVLEYSINDGSPSSPQFGPSLNLGTFYFDNSRDFTFFDKEGDGDFDLALHYTYIIWDPYQYHILLDWTSFENTGTSGMPSFTRHSWLHYIMFMPVLQSGMTSGDLNGDQLSDIVYSHSNWLGLLINDPAGGFDSDSALFAGLNDSARFRYPELVDLNSDSKLDLIVYDHTDHELAIFENTGTPQEAAWTSRPEWLDGLYLNAPFVNACDLNRDSLPDLVLNVDGHLNAYLNIGSPATPAFRHEPAAMADLQDLLVVYFDMADLDGDGDEDIIINDYGKFIFIDNETVVGVDSDIAPPTNRPGPFNYPNPFGHGTEIRFDLPTSAVAQVSIYDIGGRLIKAYPLRSFNSGTNIIGWDGKDNGGHDVLSGVYFYKIVINGQPPIIRKMTLLK